MAMVSTYNGYKVYTISTEDEYTKASFVPARGGIGSSLLLGGREILYLHDDFWESDLADLPGGWPFIFPICARLERMGVAGNYLYEHKLYNMPIHGFATSSKWEVIAAETDSLQMELTQTKDSLAMYPFPFKINLTYKVTKGELWCEQKYFNAGTKPMPYYAGFHPYFLTPEVGAGKEQVMLNFKGLRTLRYNERLTDVIGEKRLLELPASIAKPCINEQLSELDPDAVVELTYPDGLRLNLRGKTVEQENLFKYLQIYTIAQKPFICVEPWMGVPNALNTVTGVRWLQPGETETGIMILSMQE